MTTDTERTELVESLKPIAAWLAKHGAPSLAERVESAAAYIESTPPVEAAVERDAALAEMSRLYTSAYSKGHHDTVEGGYIDVLYQDAPSYFLETLQEIFEDSDYPVLAALTAQHKEGS
jgi:hypothetical protein